MSPLTSRIRESHTSALENYLLALKPDLRQFALEYLASNGGSLDMRSRAYRRFGRERVLAIQRRLAYPDARSVEVVIARKNVGRVGLSHWLTFVALVPVDNDTPIREIRSALRRLSNASNRLHLPGGIRVFRFKDPRPSLKPIAFFDREANRVIA